MSLHCTHGGGAIPPQPWSLPPAGAFFDQDELTAHLRSGGSHVLAKSVRDDWWFVAGLRTGHVFRFESAQIRGNWVLLEKAKLIAPSAGIDGEQPDRGVECRIEAIEFIWDGGRA